MCEGKTEVRLVSRLLEERLLSFGIREVFDARPIHARQLVEFEAQLATVPYSMEIEVLRIGDTQRDELDLSRFSSRVADGLLTVRKICTKPEIEILGILAMGWLAGYRKSGCKPKAYLRQFQPRFDFPAFIENADRQTLVFALKEYRRTKRHDGSEGYLADLLRDAD